MAKITIYQKPTCTKCRSALKYMNEQGVDFEAINYYEKPLTATRLKELLKKAGLKPMEAIRRGEDAYKELELGKKDYSDDELIDLMVKNPDLIQRPIIEKDGKVVLGRTPESLEEITRD